MCLTSLLSHKLPVSNYNYIRRFTLDRIENLVDLYYETYDTRVGNTKLGTCGRKIMLAREIDVNKRTVTPHS